MADPISLPIGSLINTAITFGDFCLRLQQASEDVRIFGRLIQRVRRDREEVLRQRRDKAQLFEDLPEQRQWVDEAIHDANEALRTIGRMIEGARIDEAKGKRVSMQHRFEWVLGKKNEFLTKQSLLTTCHQTLLAVLYFMHTLDIRSSLGGLSAPSSDGDQEAPFKSPAARRPSRVQRYEVSSDTLDLGSAFRDECEESFDRMTIPSPTGTAGTADGGKPWDEISSEEMTLAAADALQSLGGSGTCTTGLAEALRQPSGAGSRRKWRQRFFEHSQERNRESGPESLRAEELQHDPLASPAASPAETNEVGQNGSSTEKDRYAQWAGSPVSQDEQNRSTLTTARWRSSRRAVAFADDW